MPRDRVAIYGGFVRGRRRDQPRGSTPGGRPRARTEQSQVGDRERPTGFNTGRYPHTTAWRASGQNAVEITTSTLASAAGGSRFRPGGNTQRVRSACDRCRVGGGTASHVGGSRPRSRGMAPTFGPRRSSEHAAGADRADRTRRRDATRWVAAGSPCSRRRWAARYAASSRARRRLCGRDRGLAAAPPRISWSSASVASRRGRSRSSPADRPRTDVCVRGAPAGWRSGPGSMRRRRSGFSASS